MRLINSSKFFQNWMKKLLHKYLWSFVLIYINNIVIYSRIIENHLIHLDQILQVLENSEVSLSLTKCHFVYQSVKLLEHHVSQLEISTAEDKIEVIKKMLFFKTLKQLEVEVSFFNYYRQFIHHYVVIVKLLNHLKTVHLQPASWKEKIRKQYTKKEIL